MRRFFEFIADHPYVTVGVILAITVAFASFVPRLTTDTNFKNYMDKNDPTVQAMDRAEDRYGSQDLFMIAVENDGGIFNKETLTKISQMQAEFEGIAGVDEVTGPLNAQVITGTERALNVGPAAPDEEVPATPEAMAAYKDRVMASNTVRDYIIASDGKAAVISIKLKLNADDVAAAKQVAAIVDKYNTAPDKIYITGLPYMNMVLTESMGKDLKILLPLVILVIIISLYFSFWSLRGVILPLLVVSMSAIWTLGLMGMFNIPITIISFILPVILMAIGIAYCIHVLNKYYEEISSGADRRTAVIQTGLHMVSPVSMAGLTTVAGFLSLLNSFLIPQRQFGVFTGLGVLAAMVLSLVLIPALLAMLKVPKKKIHGNSSGILTKVLSGFERVIIRRRILVIIVSVVLFVAFLAALPMLRIETSEKEFLGADSPVVQAIDVMDRHFSGSEQVMIDIDTGKRDGLKDPAVLNRIEALQEFLESKGVKKTISIADMVAEMNQKFHADDPAYYVIPDDRKLVSQLLLLFTFQGGDMGNMALGDFSAGEVMGLYQSDGSSQQVKLAHEVQDYLDTHFTGTVHAEMVGSTQVSSSMFSRIAMSQITSLGTSILASGLIVSLLLGSIIAGLISLIPIAFTVAINFGVMAYSGTPLDMSTLMVSSIAIGIGIDYAIHFISRFRREMQSGETAESALQKTIQTTGRGIAYNALALALGFAVLLFSSFKGTSNFGLLIAMTMVISALSAFTIIPAILVTWKPGFLTRPSWGRKKRNRGEDAKGK
jgi:predicted RND superfamily exporter protein